MDDTRWQTVKEPVRLYISAHMPIEVMDDFSYIDHILDACDSALRPMWDIVGEDGYTVSQIRVCGRSADVKDQGFQTITKNAAYQVLSRRTEQERKHDRT